MSAHLHLAALARSDYAEEPPGDRVPIRVVLADDHQAVRRNLRLLLDAEDDVEVAAEATDLDAVARQLHGHQPHVLILDLHLPNGSSLTQIGELRRRFPGTQIVVMTMDESPAFAEAALRAGAIGFVLKEHSERDLVAAVRAASRGVQFISPRVAAALEGMHRGAEEHRLSARETDVLRLTALGYTGYEIADLLHISRRTVETHRASIHQKLGLEHRSDLVRYALRHGLLGA